MEKPILEELKQYKETPPTQVCHQYLMKLSTFDEDEKEGHQFDLKVKDFELANEPLTKELREFIKKYEWLGNVGWTVKFSFTARYQGKLAGVVLISEPTALSKHLNTTERIEANVQRGATASWAPKGLGSRLVMFALRWMVNNTNKRVFTAYSDPAANEIGTIYQACNWEYLGQKFGGGEMYKLPNGKLQSSRYFTRTASVKRWCKELGIEYPQEWHKPTGYQDRQAQTPEFREKINAHAKMRMNECEVVKTPKKGKYIIVIGKTKAEQKKLDALKNYTPQPYPKRS